MRTLLLILALALGQSAYASSATPQEAVQAYFTAVQSQGLAAAADHMHPAELARFKAMLLPLFSSNEGGPASTEFRVTFFGRGATEASVAATAPREFMRSFLGVVSKHPSFASLQIKSPEIVGTVPEGDVIHVLSRTRVAQSELTLTQMEVISLKKDGDDWRVMLSGNMEGMAQALKQQARRQR